MNANIGSAELEVRSGDGLPVLMLAVAPEALPLHVQGLRVVLVVGLDVFTIGFFPRA